MGSGLNSVRVQNYIGLGDINISGILDSFVQGIAGKVSRINFFGCRVGSTVTENPDTPYDDDGASFLQYIATHTNAVTTGYNRDIFAAWNPIFGGNFWIPTGGSLITMFP